MLIFGDIQMKDVELILGADLICHAHKRGTSGLRHAVVNHHQLVAGQPTAPVWWRRRGRRGGQGVLVRERVALSDRSFSLHWRVVYWLIVVWLFVCCQVWNVF